MITAFSDLMMFLKPSNLKRIKTKWVSDTIDYFAGSPYDVTDNEITGFTSCYTPDGSEDIEQYTFSYHDHLMLLYNQKQESLIHEIHSMKGVHNLSNEQFNVKVNNIISGLLKRRNELKEENIPEYIPLIKRINNFVSALKKHKITAQEKQVSSKEFRGFQITYEELGNNKEAFILQLFDKLVRSKMLNPEDKETFISVFSESWNGVDKIEWKGTTKQFWLFYEVLFNPIDDTTQIIRFKNPGRLFRSCFDLFDENGKLVDPMNEKRYRSDVRGASFYKHTLLKRIIDPLLNKLTQ